MTKDDQQPEVLAEADPADVRRIRAYLEGDRGVFSEVDSWIRGNLAVRYTALRPEVEDVCQTIHEKLFEKLQAGRFAHRSSLRTYVGGITHYVAIGRLRRLARERDLFCSGESKEGSVAPRAYRSVVALEERQLLHQAVLRSSEACRALWGMVFVERLSYVEIGRRLSIPPGTVKSRMWHCRQRAIALRQRLRSRGEAPTTRRTR